jgi:transcriptional regulator with XRE-family HTH domain
MSDDPRPGWDAFGAYLRSQRKLAQLSLRQLEVLTSISNPYLSQIERGLHQPSIAVIKSLAKALNLSVGEVLAHAAGIVAEDESATSTEAAIRADSRLDDGQKGALLAVYASMVSAASATTTAATPDESD